MALLNRPVPVYGKFGELFSKLREGEAPNKITIQFLKDLGFKSSNWQYAIGLLKGLGFVSSDGTPTEKYMDFLDKTRWSKVLGEAVKESYSDIFVVRHEPTQDDLQIIIGKYKGTHNLADSTAERCAKTFLALLELSDISATDAPENGTATSTEFKPTTPESDTLQSVVSTKSRKEVGLNYNIQIHLPATKDIAVYNAIFKSLREHISAWVGETMLLRWHDSTRYCMRLRTKFDH